jgi:hypothetical protein
LAGTAALITSRSAPIDQTDGLITDAVAPFTRDAA